MDALNFYLLTKTKTTIMYKVVTTDDKTTALFYGTYDECEEWARNNHHTYGPMNILPY